MHIRFGTSGWRGIFSEDFSFDNVRVVVQAIADQLRASGKHGQGVVVGYDTRFMGNRFAREAVRILAGAGIKSYLCDRDTPTPAMALAVQRLKAGAGINFTASHNPYDYNGIKLTASWGGLALPEMTRDIESRTKAMLGEICFREMPMDQACRAGLVEEIDPRTAYFAQLRQLVDFQAIADAGMTIAVNPLYGTSRGYLDQLLREAGVDLVVINAHPDPYFGGLSPDPTPESLGEFIALIKSRPDIVLGLATDGDADRYGIVDIDGGFIEPNCVLALLLDYLVRRKNLRGDVIRSVATSHFVDAVARSHGLEILETPVGFKFIGECLRVQRTLVGGEESAGFALRGHVPDKDGILACLLVAEMVAVEGKPLKVMLADLCRRVGTFHTQRDNIQLTPDLAAKIAGKMAKLPETLAGRKVIRLVSIDGYKLVLEDGSWVLFRRSGTESLLRIYAEAGSAEALSSLIRSAVDFIKT